MRRRRIYHQLFGGGGGNREEDIPGEYQVHTEYKPVIKWRIMNK